MNITKDSLDRVPGLDGAGLPNAMAESLKGEPSEDDYERNWRRDTVPALVTVKESAV